MKRISKKISFGKQDIFDLFLRVPEKEVAFWKSGDWWTLCFGKHKKCTDAPNISLPEKKLMSDNNLPFMSGGVGFFSYDFGRSLQNISGKNESKTPALEWRIVEECISGNEKTGAIFLNSKEKNTELFEKKVRSIFQKPVENSEYTFGELKPIHQKKEWQNGFYKTQKNIFAGEIYQMNLTRQFSANFSGNSRSLFLKMIRKNPAPHAAFFSGKEYEILSLSPELFLRFEKEKVTTEPIKGTRPRKSSTVEDEKEKENLLKSKKEAAELLMITDLLRNDLKQTCKSGTISLDAIREIQKNPTVWHTLSRISGIRKAEFSPLDTLYSCLPGGSISGCPKKRASELIEEFEPHSRGVFCGTFGFLDDSGNGEFSILIRTLLHSQGKMYFQAGGGLTADSKEEEEWEEVMQKGKVFFALTTEK